MKWVEVQALSIDSELQLAVYTANLAKKSDQPIMVVAGNKIATSLLHRLQLGNKSGYIGLQNQPVSSKCCTESHYHGAIISD